MDRREFKKYMDDIQEIIEDMLDRENQDGYDEGYEQGREEKEEEENDGGE